MVAAQFNILVTHSNVVKLIRRIRTLKVVRVTCGAMAAETVRRSFIQRVERLLKN